MRLFLLLVVLATVGAYRYPTADLEPLASFSGPRRDPIPNNLVLVAICVGKTDGPTVDKLVTAFLEPRFRIVLFHYDNEVAMWQQYSWYASTIRIFVPRQMKWWYFKRFLHPDVVAPYRHLLFLDSDLVLNAFNSTLLAETLTDFDIQLAQPSCCASSGGHCTWFPHLDQVQPYSINLTANLELSPLHHPTRLRPTVASDNLAYVGRWIPNGMIESGPFVIMSQRAWRCVWLEAQRPDFTTGSGVDYVWGPMCGQDRVAILDFICMEQENRRTATETPGWDSKAEYEVSIQLLQEPSHTFAAADRVVPLAPRPQHLPAPTDVSFFPSNIRMAESRPILLADLVEPAREAYTVERYRRLQQIEIVLATAEDLPSLLSQPRDAVWTLFTEDPPPNNWLEGLAEVQANMPTNVTTLVLKVPYVAVDNIWAGLEPTRRNLYRWTTARTPVLAMLVHQSVREVPTFESLLVAHPTWT